MNIKEIIGRTIIDILVWSKMEVGGLDEAEVSISLDNNKIIGIPWNFETMNIEQQPQKDSKSIFYDLGDIPIYYVNEKNKSIKEVLDTNKKKSNSFWEQIRKFLGITKYCQIYKIEYRKNKLKNIKNQKITDFLMIEEYESVGFFELENGYIITEISLAPSGTGLVGLKFYENMQDFEMHHGTKYLRLTEKYD